MPLFRPKGVYHGRLAFDGEDHVDPKGRKLSTDGKGNFWYKRKEDKTHLEKFHKNYAHVQGTTPADPHHTGVLAGDPHANGLVQHADAVSHSVTSHTDAYKEKK